MLPIILDVEGLNLALIAGAQESAQSIRRLAMLEAAGAQSVRIFSQNTQLAAQAEQSALPHLPHYPSAEDFADIHIAYFADIDAATAAPLIALAKQAKVLVNLEDNKPYCDFHVPAMVRHGDLLFTISTNGKSPALARRMKQDLQTRYPSIWADRLETLAAERNKWRAGGADLSELSARTNTLIDEKGWL